MKIFGCFHSVILFKCIHILSSWEPSLSGWCWFVVMKLEQCVKLDSLILESVLYVIIFPMKLQWFCLCNDGTGDACSAFLTIIFSPLRAIALEYCSLYLGYGNIQLNVKMEKLPHSAYLPCSHKRFISELKCQFRLSFSITYTFHFWIQKSVQA